MSAKKVASRGTRNLSPQVGLVPPSSSTLVLYAFWHFLSPLLGLYGLGRAVVKVMKGLIRFEKRAEELVLRPSADSIVISRMNG